MTGTTRGTRRRLTGGAAMVIGLGACLATGFVGVAHAAAGTVVQAEGDAYAVGAEASVLQQGPIHVGPVSQAQAYVPPNATQSAAASLVNCTNATGPSCVDPLVDSLNVLQSNADAGIQPVTAHCDGAPAGFGGNQVTGGSACVTIASVAALNSGPAAHPTDNVVATGVTSEAQMQGCDDSNATGKVAIATLSVGGTLLIGPGGQITDLTPPANTVIPVGPLTVILNEQHYDNSGHGWIVNAIHVFTSAADLGQLANVDLVIGHAHAQSMCDTGTVFAPPPNPNAGGQSLPVGTKADNTKFANPSEVVTYTLTIHTNGCAVDSVVDQLPSGFTYVDGSASGDLGAPTGVTQSSNPAIQQVEWYKPTGWTAATLTETLQAKVPAGAAPGDYVNNVAGDSTPPAAGGSSGCGAFEFSDTLPVNGPVAANNGTNPGIIVPRPIAAAAATPTAAPTSSVRGVTAPISTPNTGAPSPAPWATPLALAGLGLIGLARRRRSRRLGR